MIRFLIPAIITIAVLAGVVYYLHESNLADSCKAEIEATKMLVYKGPSLTKAELAEADESFQSAIAASNTEWAPNHPIKIGALEAYIQFLYKTDQRDAAKPYEAELDQLKGKPELK